ncbi:MAG TPA: DUF4126 family protein [Solirubrobacteraceae bacterium]|nr:DUF4126 family protein [Solirubrobacteraceae bacterium]
MHGIVFDIGLGAGLGAASGFRPFLPLLLAGALASAGALGVDFSPGPFVFLEEGWWLLVVTVTLVLAYAAQLVLGLAPLLDPRAPRRQADPLAASMAGLALGAGGLMFAGTLAAHHDAWWPGLLGGIAAAALAQRVVAPIILGARSRLADRGAREALSVYLDAASLAAAALVAVLHPLGYVLVALLAWMLVRTRSRATEKYAGLRILRR